MRLYRVISLIIVFLLFSLHSYAQEIPSTPRSRAAISRVRPVLEKEIGSAGFRWNSAVFIRIFKASDELEVWLKDGDEFKLFKTYPICTYGRSGLGPKLRWGDERAPEGFYFVTPRQLNPSSKFHLSFNLGYPNLYDRSHRRTGGALMVHGDCVSIGCYAMTDPGIEEIYTLLDAAFRKGQSFFRVHIFPFRMIAENLCRYEDSEWYEFWTNLKEGYDYFEQNGHVPPNVTVRNQRYVFEPSIQ